MGKKLLILTIIILAFFFVVIYISQKSTQEKNVLNNNDKLIITNNIMQITSNAFKNQDTIPDKYTCQGQNINPPFNISEVPNEAKSLVLVVEDPDAPTGTWIHWTLWNIDPKTTIIYEDDIPTNAVEGTTSFGKPGWGGPCPPSGTHRYFFKLFALNTMLNIPATSTIAELSKAMEGHTLATAEYMETVSK
mgnify:CR=1 FL=1